VDAYREQDDKCIRYPHRRHSLRAPQQQLGPFLFARQLRQTDDDKRGLAHGRKRAATRRRKRGRI
jgi:hypothetical protein